MQLSRLICVALVLVACGDKHREEHKQPPGDARQTRRVIEPSNERVGPLPPYAIRADGIGPYKLGEKLSDLLEQLASGPRIELFEITGVVHRNVIRAEDDTILVGGEQSSTASFVAVVSPEVARTESGIHVGSTRDELVAALGQPVDDPERARDPRLVVPSALANLRAVINDGRVAAIVVTAAIGTPAPPAARATDCERPPANGKAFGACLTPAGELVEVGTDDIAIKVAGSERALAGLPKFPGLVFAAPLRGSDGRDELVVISRIDEPALRSWWITAFRFEGVRPVRTVEPTQLYQLSIANARWIGADLHDIELYLELTNRPDGIDVGGLLTTPKAGAASGTPAKVHDVVVISPAAVTRRVAQQHGKLVPAEPSDAGVASPLPAGGTSGSGPGSAPTEPASAGSRGPASGHGPHVVLDAAVDATDPASTESDSNKP